MPELILSDIELEMLHHRTLERRLVRDATQIDLHHFQLASGIWNAALIRRAGDKSGALSGKALKQS